MMLLKMRCAERWKGEWRGRKWPRAEVEMSRDLVNCNAQHKIKTSLMVSENALLSARRCYSWGRNRAYCEELEVITGETAGGASTHYRYCIQGLDVTLS
jgi:hypothetical protein